VNLVNPGGSSRRAKGWLAALGRAITACLLLAAGAGAFAEEPSLSEFEPRAAHPGDPVLLLGAQGGQGEVHTDAPRLEIIRLNGWLTDELVVTVKGQEAKRY
jgi:hypothetical protein